MTDPGAHDRAPWLPSALSGLLAFAAITGLALTLAFGEFLASNGAYRSWTWVKVAFLYVLSSCGVAIHARALTTFTFRLPLMTGTAVILWVLFRAGGRIGTAGGWSQRLGAVIVCVLAFALPTWLCALVATLRFPYLGGIAVTPDRVGAALLPVGVGLVGAVAGVLSSIAAEGRGARWVAALRGGWRMWWVAMLLAFVAVLAVAAVKPEQTSSYVRTMQAAGRVGAITVVHHALLLPDQSVWVLAPSMGGVTEIAMAGDRTPSRERLSGGFYLLLLVPAVATVIGGRAAAAIATSPRDRMARGALAGVVFAGLMGSAAWFSSTKVPLIVPHALPVSIRAAMPSTMWLAVAWGVVGGVVGALSAAHDLCGPD